jgi:hypothetical protein
MMPAKWGCLNVWSTVLGQRIDDAFLVMEIHEKVVQYKFVSKTVSTLYERELVIPPPHNYQFIPSFARV